MPQQISDRIEVISSASLKIVHACRDLDVPAAIVFPQPSRIARRRGLDALEASEGLEGRLQHTLRRGIVQFLPHVRSYGVFPLAHGGTPSSITAKKSLFTAPRRKRGGASNGANGAGHPRMFHVLLSLFPSLSCRSAFASFFAVFWQRFLGCLAVLPVSGLRGKLRGEILIVIPACRPWSERRLL